MTSGMPQGSVLGPTLFVLFINDLPQVVESRVALFADDTKVFREIQSDEDREKLQQDIDELLIWSKKWQLPFNESINARLCTMGRQTERQITTSVGSKSWK